MNGSEHIIPEEKAFMDLVETKIRGTKPGDTVKLRAEDLGKIVATFEGNRISLATVLSEAIGDVVCVDGASLKKLVANLGNHASIEDAIDSVHFRG